MGISRFKASYKKKMRLELGVTIPFSNSWAGRSVWLNFLPAPKPVAPTSRERIPFWKASLKVRPMAMVSPTDFMAVVNRSSASGNFSKVQRGILTTQ